MRPAKRPRAAVDPRPREGECYWENGLLVFTAAYHLRRGWCCGGGCRHCPYRNDVADPQKK
ncbi:DUF5522 domain-containing protein [Vulcanimicrobium alpinum]|uniref:DUF5522 domain-containing protein n=1 Tax=Vulcanimicrobium alpinum TaxID=3016050 RepID=UPI00295EE327|nr:DUF5522 domain-containing protein [Vulcanimicrobium alpinum]